jgi:hypothetical protein
VSESIPGDTLTLNEHGCLLWVIGTLDAGDIRDRLYEQTAVLRVSHRRPGSTDFAVPASQPRVDLRDGPLDVTPWAESAAEVLGHISVWIADGLLHSIDFGWVTDDWPGFPLAHQLKV